MLDLAGMTDAEQVADLVAKGFTLVQVQSTGLFSKEAGAFVRVVEPSSETLPASVAVWPIGYSLPRA
jgi:hypothetical protein